MTSRHILEGYARLMVGLVLVAVPALALAPPAVAAAGPGGQKVAALARGWPGLHEQLQADHVLPGSALAKLIAENQDLGLLRPEEAADSLKLPPWLRVLWRKHHPDGRYLASDPTGGYPLLLRNLHLVAHVRQDGRRVERTLPIG